MPFRDQAFYQRARSCQLAEKKIFSGVTVRPEAAANQAPRPRSLLRTAAAKNSSFGFDCRVARDACLAEGGHSLYRQKPTRFSSAKPAGDLSGARPPELRQRPRPSHFPVLAFAFCILHFDFACSSIGLLAIGHWPCRLAACPCFCGKSDEGDRWWGPHSDDHRYPARRARGRSTGGRCCELQNLRRAPAYSSAHGGACGNLLGAASAHSDLRRGPENGRDWQTIADKCVEGQEDCGAWVKSNRPSSSLDGRGGPARREIDSAARLAAR